MDAAVAVPEVELGLRKSDPASGMQAGAVEAPKSRPEGGGVAVAELRCRDGWRQQLVASRRKLIWSMRYVRFSMPHGGAASTGYAPDA